MPPFFLYGGEIMPRASELITQSYLNGGAGWGQLPAPFENRFTDMWIDVKFPPAPLRPMLCDGSDETAKLQAIADFTTSSIRKTLYFPAGTYRITHLDLLTKLYSNLRLIGAKGAIIEQIMPTSRHTESPYPNPTFARYPRADGVFYFNSNTSYEPTFSDANCIKDIYIDGLTFLNHVETDLFDELSHQICAHGVVNFTVKNCSFIGFLGDGISVTNGSNTTYSGAYNANVTIKDNVFDGVNKDNRQAISIYHCDGFLIDNNRISNVSRSDMPGAIDIEPDSTSVIVRGGTISNNKIKNCGGGVGAICLVLKNSSAIPQAKFNITDNVIESSVFSGVTVISNDATNNTNLGTVIIENNYIKDAVSSLVITKMRNVKVLNNYIENMSVYGFNLNAAKDIELIGNTFCNILNTEGFLIDVLSERIFIEKNVFLNVLNVAVSSNSKGVRTVSFNRFVSTQTNNAPPFSTVAHTDAEALNLVIDHNTVEGTFAPIFAVSTLTNGKVAVNLSTLPSGFPYGETNFFLNGSHPVPGYPNSKAGNAKVIKSFGAPVQTTIEFYYSFDQVDPIYYRKATSTSAWGSWYKHTATLA
jgi:hypothetical protein